METFNKYDEMMLDKLNKLELKVDSMQEMLSDVRVNMAVHDVKIGRSSAFFGAISGMIVAILTAVIINFVANPNEVQPKVIYKDKTPKIELEDE